MTVQLYKYFSCWDTLLVQSLDNEIMYIIFDLFVMIQLAA
jgi:hypothetical protein